VDLVEAADIPLLDVMLSLARLSRSGVVERTAPARYRISGTLPACMPDGTG
jgi:hypothetical protein